MSYVLKRSIPAYSKSLRSLTRIRAGAVVEAEAKEHERAWKKLGLVSVISEGQHYFVFGRDLESISNSGDQDENDL